MEVNTVCVSIERHQELLKSEKRANKPKKHKTILTMDRYYSHGRLDRVTVETDEESTKVLADELGYCHEHISDFNKAVKNLNIELDLEKKEVDRLEKELLDLQNSRKSFWKCLFS